MKRHKLLSGETILLEDLGARDIAFLKNLQRMAKDGISFFELERVAIGPGSPALQGWSRVTREIVSSPLYRVAADIATRAGVAEGLILSPEHEDQRPEIPTDRSLMSVTQAANTLGISRAAVHKAIQQKRVAAQWYGNIILVSREAVLRYRQERADGGRKASSSQAHGAGGASSRSTLVAKSR
jgi:excisionase family DNA binding protein